MPFVTQDHRDKPDHNIPGDRCYLWYRWMVNEWREEPRWTTADRLWYQVRRPETQLQEQVAKELAWQVFFLMKVLPYEELKQEENGDIE